MLGPKSSEVNAPGLFDNIPLFFQAERIVDSLNDLVHAVIYSFTTCCLLIPSPESSMVIAQHFCHACWRGPKTPMSNGWRRCEMCAGRQYSRISCCSAASCSSIILWDLCPLYISRIILPLEFLAFA